MYKCVQHYICGENMSVKINFFLQIIRYKRIKKKKEMMKRFTQVILWIFDWLCDNISTRTCWIIHNQLDEKLCSIIFIYMEREIQRKKYWTKIFQRKPLEVERSELRFFYIDHSRVSKNWSITAKGNIMKEKKWKNRKWIIGSK